LELVSNFNSGAGHGKEGEESHNEENGKEKDGSSSKPAADDGEDAFGFLRSPRQTSP
jgi:hypothetical protein